MSDIRSIQPSPQSVQAAMPQVALPEAKSQGAALAVKPLEKPQITAPKANQINFDPAKSHDNLSQAISLLNQQMTANNQALGFSFDKSVPLPIVTVLNTNTGEVVRQLPSEQAVKMAHHLDSLKGFLHNMNA